MVTGGITLEPGKVLATIQPRGGGPALAAVVQPDRSVTWVPVTTPAADKPPDPPAPAPTPKTPRRPRSHRR